jgi:hypothetical protein
MGKVRAKFGLMADHGSQQAREFLKARRADSLPGKRLTPRQCESVQSDVTLIAVEDAPYPLTMTAPFFPGCCLLDSRRSEIGRRP